MALERVENLSFDFDSIRRRSLAIAELLRSATELETYIRNNRHFIPNFEERYRQDDTLNTAFVESTINLVVSKRIVKQQPMQWTPGAHLFLQRHPRMLNDELEDVFGGWFPKFRAAVCPRTS